ncbi:NAD(P)-binding domain-containing protein, partial [Gordonia otitidis]
MSDVTSQKPGRGGPVGFIGLGNMGGRMARCLVDAGVEVIGFDTVAANVADCGATGATSVKDVLSSADVVLLSLP